MSRHDDLIPLSHMLDHALEAVVMCQGVSRADLDVDRKLNLALVRLIEIIGEAANRVSKPGQASRPQLPWSKIIGMRNRLTHGYDSIDFDVLWDTVQLDLPVLIALLRAELG